MDPSTISSRLHRSTNKLLSKAKALADMQQDTVGVDKVHPSDKQDDTKESKDPKLAEVTRRMVRRQELWDRVKDRIPDIVRTAEKELKSRPKAKDSESRRSSTPQTTDSKVTRNSILSTRGKEFLKKGLTKRKVKAKEEENGEEEQKQEVRKRPDSLEQWFFDHSGGTLRERP
ncbi:hypothetical protein F4776DRAFT_665981 [Hypoxylon sp. NC0597]|nr:hypothetical protein F4776DRAFT_665981 [Hypoxylon sp. NC0597]